MSVIDDSDASSFLALQAQVDELARLLSVKPIDRVGLPIISGGGEDEQSAVETGDILTATVSAINRGTRRLMADGGITLGGDPITMRLCGEYVGMSGKSGEITVRVKPVIKGK